MRRLFALTVLAGCLFALTAAAKPPGLPTSPDTEFKVLPALAQDFHQVEPIVTSDVFVPIMPETPVSYWSEHAIGGFRHGCGGYTGSGSEIGLVVKHDEMMKHRFVRSAYEMAEAHRLDGEWAEAHRWYNGVLELDSRSPFAFLADERLTQLRLILLITTTYEVIEETVVSTGMRRERLTIMPREDQ